MPCSARCAAGPMPESISSFGVLIEEAERMTSRLAPMVSRPEGRTISTPVARPCVMTTRAARPETMATLPRAIAGRR